MFAALIALVGGIVGVGFSALPASATASTMPTEGLVVLLGPIPPAGKGVMVSGSCPSVVPNEFASLQFMAGNAVSYWPTSNPLTNGGNIEGAAVLSEQTYSSDNFGNPYPTGDPTPVYEGRAHVWFGQNTNVNDNGQAYFGETVSFGGSGVDAFAGTSVNVSLSFGGTISAAGINSD